MNQVIKSIVTGAMLYAGIVFARPVNLPEPRYVQSGADIQYVAGQRFEIPKVKDQWDEARDKTVERLRKVLRSSDDCDHLHIYSSSIRCAQDEQVCRKYEERWVTKGICPVGSSSFKDPDCEKEREDVCVDSYTTQKTEFDLNYVDMVGVSKSTSVFNDDNIEFQSDVGEEYSLDTSSSSAAAEAARIMMRLREINEAIDSDENNHHSLLGQREQVQKAYEAAKSYENKISDIVGCLEYTYGSNYKPNGMQYSDTSKVGVLQSRLQCLSNKDRSHRQEAIDRLKKKSPQLQPSLAQLEELLK